MGSIQRDEQVYGTFKFPIDIPIGPYDPWKVPYFMIPPEVFAKKVDRTYPLNDVRPEVLDGTPSMSRSYEYLRKHGFTVVKHRSALYSPAPSQLNDFQDLGLIEEVYFPEVEKLMKNLLGASHVIILDSMIRGSKGSVQSLSDTSWKRTDATEETAASVSSRSPRLHNPDMGPPARLAHWDFSPLGARQTIRNWSPEIVEHAAQIGITKAEDAVCGSLSATDKKSDSLVEDSYEGRRYALYSVWRPLKKVTRDPLAVLRNDDSYNYPFSTCLHVIKQPGVHGDWLREVATLKMTEKAAAEQPSNHVDSSVQWHYVSDQDADEVLVVKGFDSASLSMQAKSTGEARGAPHASPDIGDAAYGDARESIDVRVLAFW